MKKSQSVKLFICKSSIVFISVLMMQLPCLAQQSDDNIIWKATITYQLDEDNRDDYMYGNSYKVPECFTIRNFKLVNEKGTFTQTLSLLGNSVKPKERKKYNEDFNTEGIHDENVRFEQGDSGIYIEYSPFGFPPMVFTTGKLGNLNGLNFFREWIYNSKEHKLTSDIKDVGFRWSTTDSVSGEVTDDFEYGFTKYAERTGDTSQPVELLSPDVKWAKAQLFYFMDNDSGGARIVNIHPSGYQNIDSNIIGINEFEMIDNVGSEYDSRRDYDYPGYNLKSIQGKRLVDCIFDAVARDHVPAYKYDGEGKVGKELTQKEVHDLIFFTHESALDSGNEGKEVTIAMTYKELKGMEIIEEIEFDKSTMKFNTKATYAAIVTGNWNFNAGMRAEGHVPLFWVKLQ